MCCHRLSDANMFAIRPLHPKDSIQHCCFYDDLRCLAGLAIRQWGICCSAPCQRTRVPALPSRIFTRFPAMCREGETLRVYARYDGRSEKICVMVQGQVKRAPRRTRHRQPSPFLPFWGNCIIANHKEHNKRISKEVSEA